MRDRDLRADAARADRAAEEIEIGRDGLILELAARRGLLLPQVATEWGFDRERFLAEVSRKAGLPPDAWRRPEARSGSFRRRSFGMKGIGNRQKRVVAPRRPSGGVQTGAEAGVRSDGE